MVSANHIRVASRCLALAILGGLLLLPETAAAQAPAEETPAADTNAAAEADGGENE